MPVDKLSDLPEHREQRYVADPPPEGCAVMGSSSREITIWKGRLIMPKWVFIAGFVLALVIIIAREIL